jgi:hypothetical protein
MKTARIQVLVGFFLTVAALVIYRVLAPAFVDPDLKQAQVAYELDRLQMERTQLQRMATLETERLRVKQSRLERDADLTVYGTLGLLSAIGTSLVILAVGHSRAKVRQASVYIARIGEHSEIPIHQRDLRSFYPIAVNLSLAEMESSSSAAHDKAYQISRQMLTDIADAARAFSHRPHHTTHAGLLALPSGTTAVTTATPTMADLLCTGQITSGKPLILGFDRQGQPVTHTLQELKSVAVAGWQGSGKTRSLGYLIASSVVSDNVQVYVLDPHKAHPESLSGLLTPLIAAGYVTSVNPFDTPALLTRLNQTLDRRLNGDELCTPGILLVIDELERLTKMACFDELLKFLERCTEETRKANMTFIGCAHKWTARHFGGRADIRACMNTLLIHKTRPSQADLLLEDAHDKNLVKQLQRPGEAILVTDYSPAAIITIPFCTPQDMIAAVALIETQKGRRQERQNNTNVDQEESSGGMTCSKNVSSNEKFSRKPSPKTDAIASQHLTTTAFFAQNKTPPPAGKGQMILLGQHQHLRRPEDLTTATLRSQILYRKQQDPAITQAAIARQSGIPPARLSRILTGRTTLTAEDQIQLYRVLFPEQQQRQHAPATVNA